MSGGQQDRRVIELNDKPVNVARELVKTYGISLLEDPERLGQLLEDKCGDSKHEIFVLSFALRNILKAGSLPDAKEFEENRERIVSRFRSDLGFTQTSALWAADAIFSILSYNTAAIPQCSVEARRGFLAGLEKIDENLARYPRTAPLRKKAFQNGLLLLGILALFLWLFVRITDSRGAIADEHRILFLAHLSGNDAAMGHVRLKGAQLAVDQVNASGGVKGRIIRIQARDVPDNPGQAAIVIENQLQERKFTAIISACGDLVNASIAALADKNELPLISTESGLLDVTMSTPDRPWLYSFRTSYDNAYSGRILAYFLAHGLNRKKAALLFLTEDKRSNEIKDAFKEASGAYGSLVVYELALNRRVGLRQTEVAEIITSGADAVVFMCGPDKSAARAVQTLRNVGYRGVILGTEYDELLRNEAGDALDNSWWITQASPDDPQLLSFQTSYRDRYNEQITRRDFIGTVLAYDSVKWMADALSRAPGFQGEALRHALLSTRNLALTHATLTIDPRTHSPWNKAASLIYCNGSTERFQRRFRPR